MQAGEIRAFDDLRHSLTNKGVRVSSPNTLPTWDIIAQQGYAIADQPRDWGIGVNDQESAYKHHPVRPEHADLDAVALRSPADGKLYGFTPRTQLFGSVASVMHYNIFSRVLVVIVNRALGIPAVCYVDDYAFLDPLSLGVASMGAFHQLTDLIAIKIEKRKCKFAQTNNYLGVEGDMPSRAKGMQLSVRLPAEKAKKWTQLVADFLPADSIGQT